MSFFHSIYLIDLDIATPSDRLERAFWVTCKLWSPVSPYEVGDTFLIVTLKTVFTANWLTLNDLLSVELIFPYICGSKLTHFEGYCK